MFAKEIPTSGGDPMELGPEVVLPHGLRRQKHNNIEEVYRRLLEASFRLFGKPKFILAFGVPILFTFTLLLLRHIFTNFKCIF